MRYQNSIRWMVTTREHAVLSVRAYHTIGYETYSCAGLPGGGQGMEPIGEEVTPSLEHAVDIKCDRFVFASMYVEMVCGSCRCDQRGGISLCAGSHLGI